MPIDTKTKKLKTEAAKGCFNLYSNRKWEEVVQDGGLGKSFFGRDDITWSIGIWMSVPTPPAKRHVYCRAVEVNMSGNKTAVGKSLGI